MRWFTGSVERVTPSQNKSFSSSYGQFPSLTLDLIVNVNGEQKQFQQVPANDVIADSGKEGFIIADNKDSLYNYVKSLLKTSEDIVASKDEHEALIPKYRSVLAELMPGTTSANEVKELREQVGSLQSQIAEALALLKVEAAKKVKDNDSNV